MKKLIFLLLFVACTVAKAQTFSCPELKKDIAAWNKLEKSSNYQEWAQDIYDNKLYKQGSTGGIEYTYVITSNANISMQSLRELTLDYLSVYFKITSQMRAGISSRNAPDQILFTGSINKLATFYSLFEENYVDAKINFDIRFRENRIRFNVRIDDYHVRQTSDGKILQDKVVHVRNTFPLYRKSDHKDSYSRAFINANSKCMNYADYFVKFLNKNANKKIAEENW